MNRITGVNPTFMGIPELREIRGESVSIEEDDVIGVYGADCGVDLVVELDYAVVFGIGGFVERVVGCDPFVAFVVFGELCPEPEDAVLEVLVVPDFYLFILQTGLPLEKGGNDILGVYQLKLTVGNVASVIGVPVSVLATWCSVEIEDSVDTVLCTDVNDSVEVLEPGLFQNAGVHVIFWKDKESVNIHDKKSSLKPSKWR